LNASAGNLQKQETLKSSEQDTLRFIAAVASSDASTVLINFKDYVAEVRRKK